MVGISLTDRVGGISLTDRVGGISLTDRVGGSVFAKCNGFWNSKSLG